MEAKIISLAHCSQELFPVMDIVAEISEAVGIKTKELVSMHVPIHKDNDGALVPTETIPPQFTPQSKYYVIKTAWFRDEIQNRGVRLLKIETVQQLGAMFMFTKGLSRPTFEYLRKKVMGW